MLGLKSKLEAEKKALLDHNILTEEDQKLLDMINLKLDVVEEDPSIFFDEKEFIPKRLGDYIARTWIFKSTNDSEEIFYYKDGVYKPKAEAVIRAAAYRLLGEKGKAHYSEETISYIRATSYIERTSPPLELINLANGLYNLTTGEIGNFDPTAFFVSQLPIIYDPRVDCPLIKKFLNEIVRPEDIPKLQEFIGYCMYRAYTLHKAFMLIGSGGNGKSTLLNLLIAFLGRDNCSNIALQEFDTNRFCRAGLYGKLANIYDDLPAKSLARTGVFKQLTGNSPIEAEKKFKDFFTFNSYAKMIFSCNSIPESEGDDSDAFFRRWEIINFPFTFIGKDGDPNLLDKITIPTELSGLFNWALEGLKRLLEAKEFSYSKSIEETRELYNRMSSPAKAFLDINVIQDSDGTIEKPDLYRAFVDYCHVNNLATLSQEVFSKKVLEFFGSGVRTEKVRTPTGRKYAWKGIRIINEEDKEENEDSGLGGLGGLGIP